MKKVMVFGTFDIFHEGHKNFLKQASQKGDYLIAVVARDKTVSSIKKQRTINNERNRFKILNNNKLVDKVILGSLVDKYSAIKKYQPDVICLGYDQKVFTDKIEKKLKEFGFGGTRVIRLKSYHPEKYKSSLMKNKKGFAGMLVSIIITVVIIVALSFWWQKMSSDKLQNATQKAADEAGIKLESHDATPQGQVNAVRDMMNKIQDKKNGEIENELKK
jgi:cytidyltransferase-like protein